MIDIFIYAFFGMTIFLLNEFFLGSGFLKYAMILMGAVVGLDMVYAMAHHTGYLPSPYNLSVYIGIYCVCLLIFTFQKYFFAKKQPIYKHNSPV